MTATPVATPLGVLTNDLQERPFPGDPLMRKEGVNVPADHPIWPGGAPMFSKGNALARRHGAHGPLPAEHLEGKAAEIAAVVPVRGEDGGLHPADAYAVQMLAEVLCRIELATAHIDKHGLTNKKGEAHSLLRHLSRWEAQAREWMNDLGMTPRARVALGLNLARTRDLAQEWASKSARRPADVDADAEEE